MGKEVARNNSPGNPEKYSRLWLSTDIERVLTEENQEVEAIEGIFYVKEEVAGLQIEAIDDIFFGKKKFMSTSGQVPLTTKIFREMKNLRFFHLDGFETPTGSFDKTFRDLRWLCWKSCPLKYFPPELKPVNLGVLVLRGSIMRTLKPSMVFQKLKNLDMAYSSYLITTPDFNMLPCLVTLEFGMCVNLKKVHESIGSLAGLVYLDLGSCVKLASLPKTISSLKTLKYLYLGMCRSLVKIPEDLFRMESLEELDISGVKDIGISNGWYMLSFVGISPYNYTPKVAMNERFEVMECS
ncbi:hypothetical protein ACET3Z_033105 [Daucus carota]